MKALDEVASAQSRLDSLDDGLSSAIRAIEHHIERRISTRVQIAVQSEFYDAIAYGKDGGKWSLLVRQGDVWHRLLSASRETRARALADGHIQQLIECAPEQIRAQVQSREEASRAATALLEMLNEEVSRGT